MTKPSSGIARIRSKDFDNWRRACTVVLLLIYLFPWHALSADNKSLCVRRIVVPGYSGLARMAWLQGELRVEIEIDAYGKVISAKGTGAHPLLLEEAEKNLRQWIFGPFHKGIKFPIRHSVIYIYALKGKEVYRAPPPKVVLELPDRVSITSQPPEPQPQPQPPKN